ncbi:MAG: 3-methyl-2-oxobutanoate hydroxymethyltransferase [Candidatus Eremiobacteraeota bacterium]|nr:3-methyl-2-oxobutanoate hydroxymethyltransferase [Candidatus Eremiobacteraeota bacterium]
MSTERFRRKAVLLEAPAQKTPSARRVTAARISARKGRAPFAVMTAYDAPFARCVEEAGIDVILVGDSLGNVVLGYDETTRVTLADMVHHAAAVARGTTKAHVIVDLPFGSYQASNKDAVRSSIRLVKKGYANSVKLEGGVDAADRIRAIVRAGIPVVGHIGVLPQTASLGAGFKPKTDRGALLADARAVADAGAYALVMEAVDPAIARDITASVTIPTIGIGSGPDCDGQVLVLYDALGIYPNPPNFVKQYATLNETAVAALRTFAGEVRAKQFPL